MVQGDYTSLMAVRGGCPLTRLWQGIRDRVVGKRRGRHIKFNFARPSNLRSRVRDSLARLIFNRVYSLIRGTFLPAGT